MLVAPITEASLLMMAPDRTDPREAKDHLRDEAAEDVVVLATSTVTAELLEGENLHYHS